MQLLVWTLQKYYIQTDCCNLSGPTRYNVLFGDWPQLQVRLDIWHYMRRLAMGCTTESHPLYGTFMSRLSGCIFEWDKDDLELLLKAKKEELKAMGVPNPSEAAVAKAVSKDELAR